jgi:hypothetical protein
MDRSHATISVLQRQAIWQGIVALEGAKLIRVMAILRPSNQQGERQRVDQSRPLKKNAAGETA